jgi:hypothetical protein
VAGVRNGRRAERGGCRGAGVEGHGGAEGQGCGGAGMRKSKCEDCGEDDVICSSDGF